jgi:hypothetical protein
VWGYRAPGSAAPDTIAVWHRADRPVSVDAAGVREDDIQKTLRRAWEAGYDAVRLKNYTTPGGEIRDVIVVKDPAQLRSPSARFDPRKKNSADLLAGAAGLGVIGYSPFSDLLQER